MNTDGLKAVIFDYGNTIIEFGPEQVRSLNALLSELLEAEYGPCDLRRFTEIRKKQIIAPYATEEFIENDRIGICVELVEELYNTTPDSDFIEKILSLKHSSFVNEVQLNDTVIPVLEKLGRKYILGFISNYPYPDSITESLKKLRIAHYFSSVVISGEIGVVKPHPAIFRKSLDELNLAPEECVYVGDNWLADVQGAKRIGMRSIHTTQYVSYENFEAFSGDYEPDAVITQFSRLTDILL